MTVSIGSEGVMESFQAAAHHVHCRSAGSGRPLIFVHGGAGSAKQWKRLFEHFRRTRLVFAYDLIGCGMSHPIGATLPGRSETFTYTLDVEVLRTAIDLLGGEADVVAHSGGSLGALLAALERPEAIRTLTVFEPVLFHLLRDTGDPAFLAIRDHALEYRERFERHGPASAMEAFVDLWNGAGAWQQLSEPVRDSMLCGAR